MQAVSLRALHTSFHGIIDSSSQRNRTLLVTIQVEVQEETDGESSAEDQSARIHSESNRRR